jgi:lauroyl/myristoyl acyltransferase
MAAGTRREELFEALMVRLLRRMPITWASWLGGEIGAMRGRAALKSTSLWVQRLRRNIGKFSGITDPVEIDRRVIRFTRNIGRLYAEYPNLPRLFASGRVEIVGEEHLNDAKEPGILLCCHVGNWELVAALAQRWGGATIPYLPLGGGLRERIALEARRSWPDLELIPASNDAMTGIEAVMRLNQAARHGKTLAIFVDEERQNYIWAPSLGRTLPYAGNRWLAARLAVRHRRKIGPIFVEPLGLARYRIVIQPPLDQPDGMEGEALSRHLADQIDERVEAWVRPRIENWYWLPYFEPDLPCPIDPNAKSSGKSV